MRSTSGHEFTRVLSSQKENVALTKERSFSWLPNPLALLNHAKNCYIAAAGIDNQTFWTMMSAAPALACILYLSDEYV